MSPGFHNMCRHTRLHNQGKMMHTHRVNRVHMSFLTNCLPHSKIAQMIHILQNTFHSKKQKISRARERETAREKERDPHTCNKKNSFRITELKPGLKWDNGARLYPATDTNNRLAEETVAHWQREEKCGHILS